MRGTRVVAVDHILDQNTDALFNLWYLLDKPQLAVIDLLRGRSRDRGCGSNLGRGSGVDRCNNRDRGDRGRSRHWGLGMATARVLAESREQRAERREQRAESREQRAENREQRAESREQRAESREQRAESREQRAESRGQRAVSKEQRTENREHIMQRAGSREQRAENREQRTESRGQWWD
jgi:hypothetical protein